MRQFEEVLAVMQHQLFGFQRTKSPEFYELETVLQIQ